MTSKFGIFVGDVLGDGYDKVHLYCEAVDKLMNNNLLSEKMANEAIEYIKEIHNVEDFSKNMRKIILEEIRREYD